MTEISDKPIPGSIVEYEFHPPGRIVAEVVDENGETWYETYSFLEAEKAEDDANVVE